MKQYRVYAYDIWGNKRDGFEVNNVFKTDLLLELTGNETDQEIVKEMRSQNILNRGLHCSSFEIDGDFDFTLYVNDIRKQSGYFKPLCELRLEC